MSVLSTIVKNKILASPAIFEGLRHSHWTAKEYGVESTLLEVIELKAAFGAAKIFKKEIEELVLITPTLPYLAR